MTTEARRTRSLVKESVLNLRLPGTRPPVFLPAGKENYIFLNSLNSDSPG